jgi:hypothetical protein
MLYNLLKLHILSDFLRIKTQFDNFFRKLFSHEEIKLTNLRITNSNPHLVELDPLMYILDSEAQHHSRHAV